MAALLDAGGDDQQQQDQQQQDSQQQQDAPARPDFIPEEAWGEQGYDPAKHLEILRSTARPESADVYELPETIEGIDMDEARGSPLLAGLRLAAHEAGLDQDGFARVSTTMLTEAHRLASEKISEEKGKLGEKADERISAVNAWLGSALPAAQAKAIAQMATSADAVAALESLMKSGGRKTGSSHGGNVSSDARPTRAEIEAIMVTPAYAGKPSERDPAVIAKVDKWFEEEAKINPKDRSPKGGR